MSDPKEAIRKCTKDIICKYLGSENYMLKHTDYLKLSDEIYKATNISISLSTLRRIFNEDFKETPQISTLDAFAKYLGYLDWNNYLKENYLKNQEHPIKTKPRPNRKISFVTGIAIISIISAVLLFVKQNKQKLPEYGVIPFSYTIENENSMPSTVFFHYDLKGVKCDSATIQPFGRPTWETGDEFRIDPDDTLASYTYTWPETFWANITADGKVLNTVNFTLYTNRWLAAVSNMKEAFYIKYFENQEIFKDGEMAITYDVLEKSNFPISDVENTAYSIFKNFDLINGDSLTFECKIKSQPLERKEGSGNAYLNLFFENDAIHVPLALDRNFSDVFHLKVFETWHTSKNQNLTFLYQPLEDGISVKIETNNKKFNLSLNGNVAYKSEFETNPGKLIGMRFRFVGLGEVDYIRFFNTEKELIYSNEFE